MEQIKAQNQIFKNWWCTNRSIKILKEDSKLYFFVSVLTRQCVCLCCRLLRRLATLLSQQASLLASNEAFKKQAEGASTAAKKYMEDNELLQEVTLSHTHTPHYCEWIIWKIQKDLRHLSQRLRTKSCFWTLQFVGRKFRPDPMKRVIWKSRPWVF